MNQIIETINEYKTRSVIPLKDQQIAYIPKVEQDQIEYTVQSYVLNGTRCPVNQANQLCIKVKYLRFRRILPRKVIQHQVGKWSLEYLIDEKILYPFMLFINGLFIPWHMIDIVTNNDNYFIIVNGSDDNYISLCRNPEFIQIVTLPEYTKYIKGHDQDSMFSFNSIGEFDLDNGVYSFLPVNNMNHIVYNYWQTRSSVNAFSIFRDSPIKLSEDNVMLFINKRFGTGKREKIKRSIDCDYKLHGKDHPCLEFNYPDCEIIQNPSIRFDAALLTINDGENPNSDEYYFGVFANEDYTESADNISRVDTNYIAPIIQLNNLGQETPDYLDNLLVPFEMEMNRNKDYNTNVVECIKKMMGYNTSFFNPVFKKKSNLIIEEHNGEWVMANTRPDGLLYIPRSHSTMIDEFIIMLVNGSLYQYFNTTYYMNSTFVIPIQGIRYDDTIEFLRFQNVNNGTMNMVVNADDGFIYSPEIVNKNIVLYSNETHDDRAYTYPESGLQHFPIEYTLETDNQTGLVKIILEDEFYYNKPLKLAYKDRFKHFTFHINQDSENDEFIINLGSKFMYCPEYSRYLVFYNGKRLFSNHYRLVLPVRPTTPFSDFKIYLTFPVNKGDKLDIIYTPSLIQDVLITNDIPISGDIMVDKKVINYGLSTDLYMIWVNGKKIPASHIVDLNSNRLRVITDEKSTNNVCITKYIPDIDILVEEFTNNEALWDTITKYLNNDEIHALLGITGDVLTDTEPNVYDGAASIKSVMYELIRDEFVCNPRVDITNAFVYDYIDVDTTIIDGQDSNGNNMLTNVVNGNNTDNISGIERETP